MPNDISKLDSIKPSVEKLSTEERGLLAAYIMRHSMGAAFGAAFGIKSDPIPDGMTIGKAIDEQKVFIEKQKAEVEAKKIEQEKAEASRKALAEQMAKVLSVRLVGIQLHKASYSNFDVENYIKLTFVFENKGLKSITGIKGIATFKDKFGDIISEVPIKVSEEIKAGNTVTISLSKKYNQFEHEDQSLVNQDVATTNFSISPEVVLFDDGSKFEAPISK